MPTMEPPAYKYPPNPLHQISPERLNAKTARSSTTNSKMSSPVDAENPSPQSSPSRKAKADLFADYNPQREHKVTGIVGSLTGSPSLPAMPTFRSHGRTNSDVQGLVKRFEHLDVRDRDAESAERRKRHEAELRRAQIGREEAENDVARLREETRRLKKEGDESRDRERKVGKRLEVVMEEFANFKESHASQLAVYKEDSRKIRKEAFKSSSMVLKLQEELKSTRNTIRITQTGYDMERRRVQQREQEAFEAQYQLVAVQQELEKLQAQLQIVEEEKDALKTSLKEEEVARIAAEGMIALPTTSQDEDDLMSSPRRKSPSKRNASPFSDDKENAGIVTKKMLDSKRFDEELARERKMRQHAEELAEFLRLECHFRCCPCRSSEHAGHDQSLPVSSTLGQAFEEIRSQMRAILTPAEEEDPDVVVKNASDADTIDEKALPVIEMKLEDTPEIEMGQATFMETEISEAAKEEFSRSVTMADETDNERLVRDGMETCAVNDEEEEVLEDETLQAPRPTPAALTPEPEQKFVEDGAVQDEQEGGAEVVGEGDIEGEEELGQEEEEDKENTTPQATTTKVPLLPSSPRDDSPPATQTSTPYRSVSRTYTTTIPMKFTPVKPTYAAEQRAYHDEERNHELTAPPADSPRSRHGSAPTFDRAAALAAIAYRRERARSISDGQMTPRKQMLQGAVSRTERRDVSAPTLGQKVSSANAYVNKGGSSSAGRAVGSRSRNGMR